MSDANYITDRFLPIIKKTLRSIIASERFDLLS
jgi:hypothetical protein